MKKALFLLAIIAFVSCKDDCKQCKTFETVTRYENGWGGLIEVGTSTEQISAGEYCGGDNPAPDKTEEMPTSNGKVVRSTASVCD